VGHQRDQTKEGTSFIDADGRRISFTGETWGKDRFEGENLIRGESPSNKSGRRMDYSKLYHLKGRENLGDPRIRVLSCLNEKKNGCAPLETEGEQLQLAYTLDPS